MIKIYSSTCPNQKHITSEVVFFFIAVLSIRSFQFTWDISKLSTAVVHKCQYLMLPFAVNWFFVPSQMCEPSYCASKYTEKLCEDSWLSQAAKNVSITLKM